MCLWVNFLPESRHRWGLIAALLKGALSWYGTAQQSRVQNRWAWVVWAAIKVGLFFLLSQPSPNSHMQQDTNGEDRARFGSLEWGSVCPRKNNVGSGLGWLLGCGVGWRNMAKFFTTRTRYDDMWFVSPLFIHPSSSHTLWTVWICCLYHFCTGEIVVSAACNLASTPPLLGYIGRQFRIKKEERFKLLSGCALFLGGEFVGADEGRLKETAACPVACSKFKKNYFFKKGTSCFSGNRDTFAEFGKTATIVPDAFPISAKLSLPINIRERARAADPKTRTIHGCPSHSGSIKIGGAEASMCDVPTWTTILPTPSHPKAKKSSLFFAWASDQGYSGQPTLHGV